MVSTLSAHRYCGYEVTTEGDSFTIAFHDAFDAVCWSLAMQQAMLEADWPEALLTHEKAGTVYSSTADSSRPGQLLFRGLRVRVAISTGRCCGLLQREEWLRI
jgi:class 3 adenylate cyclase